MLANPDTAPISIPLANDQRAGRGARRVEIIDGLRGLASLAVFLFHYLAYISLFGIPVGAVGAFLVAVTKHGYLGVQVFFVLSGYVIAMTAERSAFTPRTGMYFLTRRLVRVVPPYWVMVTLITVMLLAGKAVGYFDNTSLTPGQVAAHFFYLQAILGFPWLDAAHWSLCLEVQFYAVFSLSMVALHRHRPRARVLWFGVLTLASFMISHGAYAQTPVWFPRYWYQFGLGVLVFYAHHRWLDKRLLAVCLVALFTSGLYRGQLVDITVAAVAGFLAITVGPAAFPLRVPKMLLALGRISYSLYLTHFFGGLALGIAFRSGLVRSQGETFAALAIATVVAIAFASIFYQLVERRAVQWSHAVRVEPYRNPLLSRTELGVKVHS